MDSLPPDSYTMRGPQTCGPDAVAFAAQVEHETVDWAFDWQNHEGLREDLQDTPLHHFRALERLGRKWRVVTCGEILRGECKPRKVVCLVHLWNKAIPKWMPRFLARLWMAWTGTMSQHWVVVEQVHADTIELHWGAGRTRFFLFEEFEQLYSVGTPACAYEIDAEAWDEGLSWWERAIVRVADFFF
jgi:hypothetical protein